MLQVKNLYVIMARDVTTDASDKMNSILKVIDKFTFNINKSDLKKQGITLGKQHIGVPANYAVATSWLFDQKLEKEVFLNLKINIIDPDGKKLDSGPEQENVLPAGIDKFNVNFQIQGLPISTEGKYKVEAEIFSKEGKALSKNEYPFDVEFVDGPLAVN